jgi:hypothetical protein
MSRYIPGKCRDIPWYSAIFRDIPGFHNTHSYSLFVGKKIANSENIKKCLYNGALWKPGMPEYHGNDGISWHFPGTYRNITIFSDGSHATVYKHGCLTTYFITKVMDLSHFHQKFSRVFTKNFESIWLFLLSYSVLKNKSADVSIIFELLQNCVIVIHKI